MHVVLDLWGVLLDSDRMNRDYNGRAARILAMRFDGDKRKWLEAYNVAWETYAKRLRKADWEKNDWRTVVDELDKNLILDTFTSIGVEWRPLDMLAYSRDLESQVASFVASCYEDTQEAVLGLRNAGHRLLVATQVGAWNAKAALRGAGLTFGVDDLFTGDRMNMHKGRREYWRGLLDTTSLPPADCTAVDDQLECLEAAASEGLTAVLMDRSGKSGAQESPSFLRARLSKLTELLLLIEQKKV